MHTGYVPPKVMRLRKSEIDGACNDKRYADDFFIDLVFEECNAAMASKHLLSGAGNDDGESEDHETEMRFHEDAQGNVKNEASVRRMAGTVAGAEGTGAVTVTASAYDSMLHRDSRFWDAIAQRRNEKSQVGGTNANASSTSPEIEPIVDANNVSSNFYGPTIGRRREFRDELAVKNTKTSDSVDSGDYSVISQKSALESFTIGGELDFTLDDTDATKKRSTPSEAIEKSSDAPNAVQKKDDLMDALMAIDDGFDDEDGDDDDDAENENDAGIDKNRNAQEETEQIVVAEHLNSTMTEEIVFEDSSTPQHEEVIAESDTGVVEGEAAQDVEDVAIPVDNEDSEDSSKDQNVINLDSLDLDDLDEIAQAKDGEDGFDFSDDDDDDELADLEEFLMKASS
jgi:hypothetical protein